MHPDDHALNAHLGGTPDPGLEAHLASCPDCTRRLEEMGAWGRELSRAYAEGEGRTARPEALARMRSTLAPRGAWAWRAAAAALLLAAGGLALRFRNSPSPAKESLAPTLRIETSVGVELLAAPGSRVERRGEGHWALASGACLVSAGPSGARLSLGDAEARLFDGEALIRILPPSGATGLMRDAWAEGAPAFEVAVFSGRAELKGGFRAGPGQAIRSDGALRPLKPGERIDLRASVLPPVPGSAPRLLDGRSGRKAWTEAAPAACLVSVRLRLKDPRTLAALVFEVDGRPSFWAPEGLQADGAWRTLEARISASWIAFALDGVPVRRIPRAGYPPNPAAEVPGAGLAVWDGTAEAEGLKVIALR